MEVVDGDIVFCDEVEFVCVEFLGFGLIVYEYVYYV